MFNKVMKSIHQWYFSISNNYNNLIRFEIVKDNEKIFILNLDTKRYISQLTVEKEGFHPHRFVEFYVLDIEKDVNQNPVWTYYDNKNASVKDIINNLNLGIDFITKK